MKKEIKLNLGSGTRVIPGFVNVDSRKVKGVDLVCSVEKLPYRDNSVDLIYASHVLEHFRRDNAEKYYPLTVTTILKEWYRVLKPKGLLRIAVPDVEALFEVYKRYGKLDLILGSLYGRQDYPENTHYIGFDFKSLKRLLEEVGFKNVRRYDWRKTIHKDYDDYSQSYVPHLDKENGILISLNVEADK